MGSQVCSRSGTGHGAGFSAALLLSTAGTIRGGSKQIVIAVRDRGHLKGPVTAI